MCSLDIKLSAPSSLLKKMEDLKKRSNAMVIGIRQERKEFDPIGI